MIKKQSSVANTATLCWPFLFYFFCAAGGFCRQLFFGHFIFSEDPHGLRHGKLEWMSQTPTVVLVLLNLRHCTIQCTGFGSCFSHFISETNDTILRMKSYKNKQRKTHLIEKYLLRWLSCMMEKLQCMISKVQRWQSFCFFQMGLWALWEKGDATFYCSFFCTNKVILTYKFLL